MKSNYKEDGMIIIDDFLPLDVANKLEQLYALEKKWDIVDQVRKKHYSHVFEMDSPMFPQKDEIYSARFKRSDFLEDSVSKIFEDFFSQGLQIIILSSK